MVGDHMGIRGAVGFFLAVSQLKLIIESSGLFFGRLADFLRSFYWRKKGDEFLHF